MRQRNLLGIIALAAAALSGCASSSTAPAALADVRTEGPPAPEWQGVYQGPYHVFLAIESQGERAHGTWHAMGGRRGQLWGRLSGNLLRFAWQEHDTASPSEWSGRGYFVLQKQPGDQPVEIHGEWGFGRSDTGRQWWAVKRPEVPVALAETTLVDKTPGGQDEGDDASACVSFCGDDFEGDDPFGL